MRKTKLLFCFLLALAASNAWGFTAPTTEMWYTIKTPKRNNYYISAQTSIPKVYGSTSSKDKASTWRIRKRTDGTYDILTLNWNTYVDITNFQTSGSKTTCLNFTSSQPSKGWSFGNSKDGYYIIKSGTIQWNLNNQETTLPVLNWGGGTNTSDAGCQLEITEIDQASAKTYLSSYVTAVVNSKYLDTPIGTAPGTTTQACYDALHNAYDAANAAVKAGNKDAQGYVDLYVALENAYNNFKANVPSKNRYYYIESAYSEFISRSKHMCMYANSTKVSWTTFNASNENFYVKAEAVNGNKIQFAFCTSGNKYMSSTATLQSGTNTMNLTFIGARRFGIQPNGASNFCNPKDHGTGTGTSGDITIWGSANSASNEWYIIELSESVSLQDLITQAKNISAPVGTNPGFFSQEAVNTFNTAITTAETALNASYGSLSAAKTGYNNAKTALQNAINTLYAAVVMPTAGKYYVIESAYSIFTDNDKHMCICTNGSTIGWKEYDANDLSFVLKAEEVEGSNVQFKFFKDNQYVATQSTYNAVYATQSETNDLVLLANGKGSFGIQAAGSSNFFNPKNHTIDSQPGTSGDIVNWGSQFSGSNEWILKEVAEPTAVNITYNLKKGGTTMWTTSIAAELGKPFPSVSVNPFIVIDKYPEGNVTAAGEYNLDWHCVVDYADAPSSLKKWYALDIRAKQGTDTHNYPLYGDANTIKTGEDADDFRSGAVKNENYMWGFITDNPCNNNFKIYNKGQGKYAVKEDGENQVNLSSTGDDFIIYTGHTEISNSYAFGKVESTRYCWNEQKGLIKGWNGLDQGSSIRIFEVTPSTDEVSYAMGADYGTLIVPFYAEIPEDAKVYTCSAINGNVLTLQEETAIIKPNTAYIIEGEEYSEWSFSNTSKLTTIPAMAATGIMVGTYEATNVGAIYSYAENNNVTAYVLTKVGGRAAFQYLDSEAASTYATNAIGANRCILIQPKGSSVKSTLYFDEETGISLSPALSSREGEIFNLAGQRVEKLQKGVNIINGKKVIY